MDGAPAKDRYDEAKALYRAGKYAEALKLLDALQRAYPQAKNILLAKAECLIALGWHEDAAALCEQVLQQHDDARARRLLGKARGETAATPGSDAIVDLALDDGLSAAFEPVIPPRETPKWLRSAIILAIVGGALVLGALFVKWRVDSADTGVAAYSAKDVAQFKANREVGPGIQPEETSRRAGREIPEEVWRKTAVIGVPDWQPGIYRRVPCPGAYFMNPNTGQEPRSIDVFIPKAYGERPADRFPFVAISMPHLYPGFIGLVQWAEQNDVILVTINSSSNRTYAQNVLAQDAALGVVFSSMRVHDRLGFAIGSSGGAATSWEMICNYPQRFAGVVMIAFGTSHNDCWIPRHVRVGYIYGARDFNVPAIEQAIPRLRASGNQVRVHKHSGGHQLGALGPRVAMLDWMVKAGRRDFGLSAPAPGFNPDKPSFTSRLP